MAAIRLEARRIEKPWGRTELWPGFVEVEDGGEPVGEIWFETPGDAQPELLVKYLFTSERLSIQVHPDDAAAQAAGHARGKDEAWVILAADPHATIALGMIEVIDRERLRSAALDGSIEKLVDWKAVKAGDSFYSPAGTVHAIGAGLTLVEVQQNVDLTYRLYDYGRPRELHLEEGVAVADPVPYVAPHIPHEVAPGRMILADGPKLVLERWSGARATMLTGDGRPLWLIPLGGTGTIEGGPLRPGEVWMVDGAAALTLDAEGDMLVAYPGVGIGPL